MFEVGAVRVFCFNKGDIPGKVNFVRHRVVTKVTMMSDGHTKVNTGTGLGF